MSVLLVVLIVLAVLALVAGGGLWAEPRYGPYWGWSPLAVVALVLVVLWLLGSLR